MLHGQEKMSGKIRATKFLKCVCMYNYHKHPASTPHSTTGQVLNGQLQFSTPFKLNKSPHGCRAGRQKLSLRPVNQSGSRKSSPSMRHTESIKGPSRLGEIRQFSWSNANCSLHIFCRVWRRWRRRWWRSPKLLYPATCPGSHFASASHHLEASAV